MSLFEVDFHYVSHLFSAGLVLADPCIILELYIFYNEEGDQKKFWEQDGINHASICEPCGSKSALRCSKSSKPMEIRSSNGEMAESHFLRHSMRLSSVPLSSHRGKLFNPGVGPICSSFRSVLSYLKVTPEGQLFDAIPIWVPFSPAYQPPSSEWSSPGLNMSEQP